MIQVPAENVHAVQNGTLKEDSGKGQGSERLPTRRQLQKFRLSILEIVQCRVVHVSLAAHRSLSRRVKACVRCLKGRRAAKRVC